MWVLSLLFVVGALAEDGMQESTGSEEEVRVECGVIDFEEAIAENGVVSIEIAGVVTMEARAVTLEKEPAGANLYDTSAGTGVDPDLDVADIGKVLIIQENNENFDVPDDEWRGGIMTMSFTAVEDDAVIWLEKMTFLDFEEDADLTVTTVDGTEVESTVPGSDKDSSNFTFLAPGGMVYDISEIELVFRGSGAVDDIHVCVESTEPTTGGFVTGDPHVHTHDGHVVDIWLPVGPWVEMMTGEQASVWGHVFDKDGDKTIQWFDGIAVLDAAADNRTVFNATIPHDVPIGEVGAEIKYFRAEFDGAPLQRTNHKYVSEDGRFFVDVRKSNKAVRGGRHPVFNDEFVIRTPDFSFKIENSRETNKALYSSRDEQFSFTHIDIEVYPIFNRDALKGPLLELMYRDPLEQSAVARAWTRKENAYATTPL